MKRTPLIFAALVPFAVGAGQSTSGQAIDHNELRNDLQVTTLLGTDVTVSDGQQIGSIEDILIDSNGRASVIIQREGDLGMGNFNEADNAAGERTAADESDPAYEQEQVNLEDDAEDFGEVGGTDVAGSVNGDEEAGMDQGLDPDRAGSNEMGDDHVQVEWSAIEYNAEEESARLGDVQDVQPVAYEQTGEAGTQQAMRASMLIGMEVNLADDESFGEVEDVMLDPATGQASALVIDSMEFFDKERYAVPINLNAVNAEEEEITLQYSQQQLEDMGEFDMEQPAERT